MKKNGTGTWSLRDAEVLRKRTVAKGDLLECAIPILGGMYATLLGRRVIGNGTRLDAQLRFRGPVLMLFGYMILSVACRRYPNGLLVFGFAFLIGAAVMLLAVMRSPRKITENVQVTVSAIAPDPITNHDRGDTAACA